MYTKRRETEILQNALQALQKTTKLTADVQFPDRRLELERIADAVIRITGWDMEWHFVAEIKNTLTPANLGGVINELRQHKGKGIIITQYVTPQMAERLKEMNTAFIDTAGNAYLNELHLFVFIKGNKPAERHQKERPTRAFQATGLQLIFGLLCNPGLEATPFRQIAHDANVALGTVGWVMRDLKQMGYLVDMGKRGRRLVRKKELANRWATAYPEQLRPRLMIGLYRADRPDWWKDVRIIDYQALWGGEIAAARLTGHLKPQIATIYTNQPLGELLLKNRLKKDPGGNVEILTAFWPFKNEQTPLVPRVHEDLVPPLLVFADLLAADNSRNIETAEILYEKHLARFVGQD